MGTAQFLPRVAAPPLDDRVAVGTMHPASHGIRDLQNTLTAGIQAIANLIDEGLIKQPLDIELVEASNFVWPDPWCPVHRNFTLGHGASLILYDADSRPSIAGVQRKR
jgi:hypothetical protein